MWKGNYASWPFVLMWVCQHRKSDKKKLKLEEESDSDISEMKDTVQRA